MVKHKKLPKDPNAPKKPTRPYIYFLMEVRKQVSQEMTKEHDEVGTHHHEVSRECARRWAILPAERKEKYHEKFREDQNRYREALKSYTPSPEFQERVRLAKLNNSTGPKAYVSNPRHDPNIVKVPHMIRAYFDYMASTWAIVAASHPSYNPGQVQDEIWRRWSQGDNGGGGSGSSVFDENQNIEKKQLKKRIRKRTALKNPLIRPPRQAFDCYLETLTDEVRKLRPDLSDTEMHKLVSAKWKEMTDVQKLPFFEVERKEKQRYEVQMKKVQSKGEATIKGNETKGYPVRLSGNVQKQVVIRPDVADIDDKVAVTQEQHNVNGIKEEKKEPDSSVMTFDIDDSLSKISSKEEEKVDVSANEYANNETSAHKNLVDYSSDSSYQEEVEADAATILSTCSGSSDDSSDDDSDNMFVISTPVDQIGLAGKPLPQ